MRRCIIHIGHPKTASTYLQHCLHLNQRVFAQAGYWVPTDFRSMGFYDLESLSLQGRIVSGNLAPMHVLVTDGPNHLVPEMEELLFGAPGMPADCDVILSSELFFYYWPSTVALVRTARARGFEPLIVAYLPRQDRAAILSYLQNVRVHGFTEGVADFMVHDRNIPYCRYVEPLGRLGDHVGDNTLLLRSFDAAFLHGGDVLQDFLTVTGCRVEAGALRRPAVTSNQGLTLEQYELLRAATLMGQQDAMVRLRDAETALTAADRERTFGYYYRAGLRHFLTETCLPGNRVMVERFMKQASEEEKRYWLTFEPVPPAVAIDAPRLAALREDVF